MIYKTAYFHRWQIKNKIANNVLVTAIEEIKNGLLDADLGGFVIKKRIPRLNSGKRGGYRTVIATAKGEYWFFIYGFS